MNAAPIYPESALTDSGWEPVLWKHVCVTGPGDFAMAQDDDVDRTNDGRLLTPLLIMAMMIVCGFLFYSFAGQL